MAYVVTGACFGCLHSQCVQVCPTDSFRLGEKMRYIDPESCIDCDACLHECPVEAIFPDHSVPEDQHDFIALNAEMAKVCPVG